MGLWEDRPKHACLRRCLNRKRFHTLLILLSLPVAERTRAREVGKRKPVATASDFVQKSLALRIEIMIAVETRSNPPSTLPSHPTKSGSAFNQPPRRVTRGRFRVSAEGPVARVSTKYLQEPIYVFVKSCPRFMKSGRFTCSMPLRFWMGSLRVRMNFG